MERLQNLFGDQLVRDVMETIGSLKEAKDFLVSLPDKNGVFSTKSA